MPSEQKGRLLWTNEATRGAGKGLAAAEGRSGRRQNFWDREGAAVGSSNPAPYAHSTAYPPTRRSAAATPPSTGVESCPVRSQHSLLLHHRDQPDPERAAVSPTAPRTAYATCRTQHTAAGGVHFSRGTVGRAQPQGRRRSRRGGDPRRPRGGGRRRREREQGRPWPG